MQGDIILWALAVVRAVIVSTAVVLAIFLVQELFLPQDDLHMRAPAFFYKTQDWIEEWWSSIEINDLLETYSEMQRNWNLHVRVGLALAGCLTIGVSWLLYSMLVVPYLVYRNLKMQGLKGVAFRPFIGQIPEMRQHIQRKKKDAEYAALLFPQAREAEEKYGDVYLSQIGTSIRVVLTNPAAIKDVLVTKAKCFEKAAFARRLLSVLGNGLVFSEGAKWDRQRRMINPAFSHTKIKAMTDIMVRCANEAAERWCEKLQTGPGELDMQYEFSRLTLDVIGRAAFGTGGAASEAVAADEVYVGMNKLLEEKVGRIMSGMEFIPGYSLLPTPGNRSIKRKERKLRTMGLQLIKQRRESRDRGLEKEDLLGLMLAAQDEKTNRGMTDEQLLDECMTFLLAGHETTAVLLTWTTYLLTKHPEYCERAREEVLEVLAGRDEVPFDDLHKLKLLQCILYESLRLFPPVPILGRLVVQETEVAGFKLPKGAEVSIMSYPMHIRKSLWGKDAMDFRPERFSNGISSATKHPSAFLPFSAGPRNCIGQTFAMTEAKIILVKILRTFSLKLAPGYRHSPVMFITMKPGFGLPIILERLEKDSK